MRYWQCWDHVILKTSSIKTIHVKNDQSVIHINITVTIREDVVARWLMHLTRDSRVETLEPSSVSHYRALSLDCPTELRWKWWPAHLHGNRVTGCSGRQWMCTRSSCTAVNRLLLQLYSCEPWTICWEGLYRLWFIMHTKLPSSSYNSDEYLCLATYAELALVIHGC